MLFKEFAKETTNSNHNLEEHSFYCSITNLLQL